MSPQQHVWACALAIERQHGNRAAVVVAERIGALALAGDREGIAMWKAIRLPRRTDQGSKWNTRPLNLPLISSDRVILVRKRFSLAA